MSSTRKEAVLVIGGSISGLFAALELSARGFGVTIVERDESAPESLTPAESGKWFRGGAPHTPHPHFLTARLRSALHATYPDLIEMLLAAGAWELKLRDMIHPAVRSRYRPEPGDDEIAILMSRRTTLELVLRRYVASKNAATILSGVQVRSLIVTGESAPFSVRGVRVKDSTGEREILADIIIDASGRSSKCPAMLRAAGAEVLEETHESNSFYYTRHYQTLPGKPQPRLPGDAAGRHDSRRSPRRQRAHRRYNRDLQGRPDTVRRARR